MSFLISKIKDQKILEMDVVLDDFIQENGITENMVIHSVLFDKSVFKEETEAREYLKEVLFEYHPLINADENNFIATIVAPSQIDTDTEIQVQLRRGVTLLAAELLPIMTFEEVMFNDKGEINLSSKFGAINLHEGLPHIIEIARVAEGEHASYGKISITQETLEAMEVNFKSNATGVDLAVNEDHRKNEAFGWFKDVFLSFDNQTLYGQVQWNTKGIQALSEKEYRYFSPEFRFNYKHPHSGQEFGPTLLGGALTNYPFLKMEAITELNNKESQGDEIVTKETSIDLSEHNSIVVDLNSKLNAKDVELSTATAKTVELSNKVEELQKEIDQKNKEQGNQKLFDAGKINAAQLVALNEGKGMLEVLALNEKMNTEAAGGSTPADKEIKLSEEEKRTAKSLDLTEEEFIAGNK
jgi:phage I-like protein